MEAIFWIWVGMGIVSSLIAGSKGGSYFGWLFLGLIFGPVAWLFAALKTPIKAEKNSSMKESLKNCPFCAEDIKKDAILCKHCKKEIKL